MAVIKCKMCGGDLEVREGLTVAECEYCGSRQTIPTADNEKKLTLFGRAGRLLRSCEFDKAAGVFESIVADFPEEAEAYWGLVLCKYGIEYVDDPATGKKIPTCHRSSFDSVLDDENFEQACENADAVARSVYRAEARAIEELRKGIIQVSSREEPYDVFICYKETDDKGERTLDSVIAQDIYTALTEKGYRVFFSRISLEDKLGVEYEPYIFAALNSAKLMLAVGTDYEHFNAVWVKNEWSRFLALIASGQKKTLIPCFKNIDAYDMPREFAKLSAQDMGKVGAMQDLLRGVEKILGSKKEEKQAEPVIVSQPVSGGPNVRAMIDRGNMALEDGKWQEAAEFFNRALDMDARCADAYLGQLLAKNQCADDRTFVEKRLAQYPASGNATREIACDEETKRINAAVKQYTVDGFLTAKEIKEKFQFDRTYITFLPRRKAQLKAEEEYLSRENDFLRAEKFASGNSAERVANLKAEILDALRSQVSKDEQHDRDVINRVKEKYAAFLDEVEAQVKKLREEALAKQAECERKYQEACELQAAALTKEDFENAEKAFGSVTVYKDANTRKTVCREKAHEFDLARDYQKACEMQAAAVSAIDFNGAARAFDVLDGYLDSLERRESCRASANKILEKQDKIKRARNTKVFLIILIAAISVFTAFLIITGIVLPANHYKEAEELFASGNYEDAALAYAEAGSYKDAQEKYVEVQEKHIEEQEMFSYERAEKLSSAGNYAEAALAYSKAGNYKNAQEKCLESWKNSGIWSTISAGSYHTVGLKANGTVVAVGANWTGECNVSSWSDIVAVSASSQYTVGLKSNGTVVTAGKGYVSDWSDIVAISAGNEITVGLKSDGTVVATGSNDYGQCNVSDWNDIIAISTYRSHTVGLKPDGTVVAVGNNEYGQCDVSGWNDIVAISAGAGFTVGLKSDGTVVAVGYNEAGQCDVSGWSNIVAVSAGGAHTVGLKSDGTVVTVGNDEYGLSNVSAWSEIVAISAGGNHTVGLKSDGTVVAVGNNEQEQRNVSHWRGISVPDFLMNKLPAVMTDAEDRGEESTLVFSGESTTISTGDYCTMALKSDGTVVTSDTGGIDKQVTGWRNIVAVSTTGSHTVGLKSDGTVVAAGISAVGQCDVSEWRDIEAISTGLAYTVGLKSDGTVVATGRNEEGQCDVDDWRNIVAIGAGDGYTVGLKADGTIEITDKWKFFDATKWYDIAAISVADDFVVGLRSDGTVVVCGYDEYAEDVMYWYGIVAICAGEKHIVGLKSDGTVVAVGNNKHGQCEVSGWRNIVAISAGSCHTVGLKSDGTVVAVGRNNYGQCDVSDWRDIKLP